MDREEKKLIKDLLASGHSKEAVSVYKTAVRLTAKEQERQIAIISDALDYAGFSNPNLIVDLNKGVASFFARNMSLVDFPRALENLLGELESTGTREYKLQRVDRSVSPTRVYLKL